MWLHLFDYDKLCCLNIYQSLDERLKLRFSGLIIAWTFTWIIVSELIPGLAEGLERGLTIEKKGTHLWFSYLYSHFDLSSLISMARMQSAQRKKARKIEKVVTPARDRIGDLLITCQMRWPLRYWDHLISIAFCAILSGSSYCITVIHEWGWSIAMQRVLNQLGA